MKKKLHSAVLLFFLLLSQTTLKAQFLKNGSFEINSSADCTYNPSNEYFNSLMYACHAFGSASEIDIQKVKCSYVQPVNGYYYISLHTAAKHYTDALSMELTQYLRHDSIYPLSFFAQANRSHERDTLDTLEIGVSKYENSFGKLIYSCFPPLDRWQKYKLSFHLDSADGDSFKYITVRTKGSSTGWIFIDEFLMFDCPPPQIDLGKDTFICPGDVITLDAYFYGATNYRWQDGSTRSTYTVTKPGTYTVAVKKGKCEGKASINVRLNPLPEVDLGPDLILCQGEKAYLDARVPDAAYVWQDKSTGPGLVVTKPGKYWVKVTRLGCSASDTVYVGYEDAIKVDLGDDKDACEGEAITLDAGNPGSIYLWQNGSKERTYKVTKSGTYKVTVYRNQCWSKDSVHITFHPYPAIDLGKDTVICGQQSLLLNVNKPDLFCRWQDGSTGQQYLVKRSGKYWVEASSFNCKTSDTIHVKFVDYPLIELGKDTTLCRDGSTILKADIPGAFYRWQDGSTKPYVEVTKAGKYWLEVTKDGCSSSDTIMISTYDGYCNCFWSAPNVFTPNSDGINDVFRFGYSCPLESKELLIYNRWGELLYDSESLQWDGRFKGEIVPEGVYLYLLQYKQYGKAMQLMSGNFTVLK